ncbi:MAG: hypothetical protein QM809_01475 [Gordonia sp. (in: high G+C Gram-positive bacteria)]|uniref:hypothetical protein n=1 Tax=Gordonia sp. (in: high G+C Gram-positive bacteria) TaxID=84139 RepID=UPI0039E3C6A2
MPIAPESDDIPIEPAPEGNEYLPADAGTANPGDLDIEFLPAPLIILLSLLALMGSLVGAIWGGLEWLFSNMMELLQSPGKTREETVEEALRKHIEELENNPEALDKAIRDTVRTATPEQIEEIRKKLQESNRNLDQIPDEDLRERLRRINRRSLDVFEEALEERDRIESKPKENPESNPKQNPGRQPGKPQYPGEADPNREDLPTNPGENPQPVNPYPPTPDRAPPTIGDRPEQAPIIEDPGTLPTQPGENPETPPLSPGDPGSLPDIDTPPSGHDHRGRPIAPELPEWTRGLPPELVEFMPPNWWTAIDLVLGRLNRMDRIIPEPLDRDNPPSNNGGEESGMEIGEAVTWILDILGVDQKRFPDDGDQGIVPDWAIKSPHDFQKEIPPEFRKSIWEFTYEEREQLMRWILEWLDFSGGGDFGKKPQGITPFPLDRSDQNWNYMVSQLQGIHRVLYWLLFGESPDGKDIHHNIEQQIFEKLPDLFSAILRDSPWFLRGIWLQAAPIWHQGAIRRFWNAIYSYLEEEGVLPGGWRSKKGPTRMGESDIERAQEALMAGMWIIDILVGEHMVPRPRILELPQMPGILEWMGFAEGTTIEEISKMKSEELEIYLKKMLGTSWKGGPWPFDLPRPVKMETYSPWG